MSSALKRPTYADIEALPEHVVGEILGGELVVRPRPAKPHTHAASILGALTIGPFTLGVNGPGGWWIEFEPELHLDAFDDCPVVVPDLAGWRHTTLPAMDDAAAFVEVPDWICEVLSPGTAALDRAVKMPFYARVGVGHAWLIDPILQTLEVYRLEGGGWRVLGTWRGDAVVRVEPFDAIELPLALLWGRRAG